MRMEKDLLKGVWYWYYINFHWLYKIIFIAVMGAVVMVLFSDPIILNNIWATVAITGTGVVLALGIGEILSWLHDGYLVHYDNGYRWIRRLPPRECENPFRISNRKLLSAFKIWFIEKLKLIR